MKAEEIKNLVFRGFIEYLEREKIGDHFSMDIWMSKVWDRIFEQYEKTTKDLNQINQWINNAPIPVLESIIKVKQEEENEKKKKKIITPDKKVITPSNFPPPNIKGGKK